jgi:hypothetical protein
VIGEQARHAAYLWWRTDRTTGGASSIAVPERVAWEGCLDRSVQSTSVRQDTVSSTKLPVAVLTKARREIAYWRDLLKRIAGRPPNDRRAVT